MNLNYFSAYRVSGRTGEEGSEKREESEKNKSLLNFLTLFALLFTLYTTGCVATAFASSWHEDYGKALRALKSNNWQTATELLNSTIRQKGNPKTRAKTYGLRFIDYLPYLYRGIAYYNLGEYRKARNDLEKSLQFGQVQKAKQDRKAKVRLRKHLSLLKQKEMASSNAPKALGEKNDEQKLAIVPDNTVLTTTEKQADSVIKPRVDSPKVKINTAKKSVKSSNRVYNSNITSTQKTGTNNPNAFDDEFKAALVLFNDGEFHRAKESFVALEKKSPNKYETEQYLNRINRVEKMVRVGITAFFEGDHDRSIAQLSSALKNNFINADVHAFLGCAYAAKYLLQGASDNSLRLNAVEQFAIATRLSPNYNWDQRYISPSIINLFNKRN